MIPPHRPLTAATSDEVRVAITLGVATVLYLAYHLVSFGGLAPGPDDAAGRTRVAWRRRVVGMVLFGVVPAVPAALLVPGGLAACGLTLEGLPDATWLGAIFVVATLPLVLIQSRKPAFQAAYPEVRAPLVGRTAALNALSWAGYLVAYELFFRGFLVLGLAPVIGPLPALAVSLMGYVWVHLGKYPGEAVGTVVSGAWFGWVALHTGTIAGPILAHLLVALASDHLAADAARRAGRGR